MTPRMSNKVIRNRNKHAAIRTRTRPPATNAAYAKIDDCQIMCRQNDQSRQVDGALVGAQRDVNVPIDMRVDGEKVLDNNNNNSSSTNTYTLLSPRVRTRRTRRRTTTETLTTSTTRSLSTPTATATATSTSTSTSTQLPSHSHSQSQSQSSLPTCNATASYNIWSALPRWSNAAYVIALLLLTTTTSSLSASASPCEANNWWDPVRDKCITCTVCQGEMIPLRPCQLHRDTICGSIYDLKIDWVVLAKTEPNWKERRKSDGSDDYELEHLRHHASATSTQLQHLTPEQLQQLHDEAIPLDWQTCALFLAVLACLLFFLVAACILIHHMRQWRRMERRLDQDVEELSTKLMAKLAEVQSLEGGTFFIGNADALRIPTTTNFQPQHVLLPAEKPSKHHERRVLKTLQPGNVYIEENGSKG